MNFIKVLMTLYFVGLILVPCNDIHSNPLNANIFSELEIRQASHSKDIGDVCSPLCFCNCCHMNVTSYKNETVAELFQNYAKYFTYQFFFHRDEFISQVYNKIWQPPKTYPIMIS